MTPATIRPSTVSLAPAWVARASFAPAWAAVAILGVVEGLFGRTQYLGDSLSYLNVSRAVSDVNWPAIFDPMWSPGYPFLVALARGAAPHTPEGEWYGITILDVVIFLCTYGAWRWLIREAIACVRPDSTGIANHPLAIWTTTCLFLGCGLGLQSVSSATPDLLVMTGFLFGATLTLRVIRRQTFGDAAALGLLLGLWVWVKGISNTFAVIFLFVLFLDCCSRRTGWRFLVAAAAVYLPLFAGYAAAISSSYGELTFGATGPLNYAFHVDQLPRWTNWQGGPTPFGAPIHRTRQLFPDLPVFEFSSPFQTTYSPFNNLAYWYQGVKVIPTLQLQARALYRSIYLLAKRARPHPIIPGVALAYLVSMLRRDWRRVVWLATKSGWPVFTAALLGLGAYAAVHVEDRYLGAFVLVLGLLPLAPLLDPKLVGRRSLALAMTLIMTVTGTAEIAHVDGWVFRAAARGVDFHDDPQWRLAEVLSAHGLRPGDKVAVIRDTTPPYRVHWAYVSHLQIVAEFGGVPWRVDPETRMASDDDTSDPGDRDYGRMFWFELTPTQRAAVIEAFRSTGAHAVISLRQPDKEPEPGWIKLDGVDALIYDFPDRVTDAGAHRNPRRAPTGNH